MKVIGIIGFVFLCGCNPFDLQNNPFEPEMKCEDGLLYVKRKGAYVEAKAYTGNKCLELERSKR